MILAGNQKINYIYSASGEKLACDANGSLTYYRSVMVYGADDKLLYMFTPEGTVSRTEGSAGNSYTYNYFKKDHIGSTRAMLSAVDDTLQSVQSTDYYPFGLAFSTNNLNKNKYLFSGKELQDGNLGGSMLGLYDFGARHYDPFVARWLKQDRYAAKYASASPYGYCLNNPVGFSDPTGDTIVVFYDGHFSHIDYSGNGMHILDIVQGPDGKTDYNQYLSFNDPNHDFNAVLEGGHIHELTYVSDADVSNMMQRSGVTSTMARLFPYAYAWNQSVAGKMDYGANYGLSRETFYVRNGIAYNLGDYGNYLWGAGMATLGIPYINASIGAHLNNMFSGKEQQGPTDYKATYYFGPGTYSNEGMTLFDSPEDQRAIYNGYMTGVKLKY